MGKLSITETIEVNTNALKTWDIVGPNFINIADWARGVTKSWEDESVPKRFENAPTGGRACEVVGMGKFEEIILHYDDSTYEISWSAKGDKMPGFISNLQNALKVEVMNDTSCRIHSNLTADLGGIMGFLMGFVLKKNFTKLIKGFLSDWKTYAETGNISETKKREIIG